MIFAGRETHINMNITKYLGMSRDWAGGKILFTWGHSLCLSPLFGVGRRGPPRFVPISSFSSDLFRKYQARKNLEDRNLLK